MWSAKNTISYHILVETQNYCVVLSTLVRGKPFNSRVFAEVFQGSRITHWIFITEIFVEFKIGNKRSSDQFSLGV